MMYPKPTKRERVKEKEDKKKSLIAYRRHQSALAILRDNDQCVICWFVHKRVRRREHIHHVYSRGREAGDWREHYINLMCVCASCHPLPIQTPGGSANLGWVEDVREQMNNDPINSGFEADS